MADHPLDRARARMEQHAAELVTLEDQSANLMVAAERFADPEMAMRACLAAALTVGSFLPAGISRSQFLAAAEFAFDDMARRHLNAAAAREKAH